MHLAILSWFCPVLKYLFSIGHAGKGNFLVTVQTFLSMIPLGFSNFSNGNSKVSCAAFINLAHAGKAALTSILSRAKWYFKIIYSKPTTCRYLRSESYKPSIAPTLSCTCFSSSRAIKFIFPSSASSCPPPSITVCIRLVIRYAVSSLRTSFRSG